MDASHRFVRHLRHDLAEGPGAHRRSRVVARVVSPGWIVHDTNIGDHETLRRIDASWVAIELQHANDFPGHETRGFHDLARLFSDKGPILEYGHLSRFRL